MRNHLVNRSPHGGHEFAVGGRVEVRKREKKQQMNIRSISIDSDYQLRSSIRFLEGFTPAAYESERPSELTLAFPSDGAFLLVAVRVRQEGTELKIEIAGEADPDAVVKQVERILSLDHDASGYREVIIGDPALAAIAQKVGLIRPVLFPSPYEAAAWVIIGNRIRMTQAGKLKQQMAQQLGDAIDIGGDSISAFPPPSRLLEIHEMKGLTSRKIDYLHQVAAAALEGDLDPDLLAGMPFDQAFEHVQRIEGIGPFGAELILIRGLGSIDQAPTHESRLRKAVELAYQREIASDEELHAITEGWSPFRSWVSVLLRTNLEMANDESGGGSDL